MSVGEKVAAEAVGREEQDYFCGYRSNKEAG